MYLLLCLVIFRKVLFYTFVHLIDNLQDYSKPTLWFMVGLCGRMRFGPGKNQFNSGADLDKGADAGICCNPFLKHSLTMFFHRFFREYFMALKSQGD